MTRLSAALVVLLAAAPLPAAEQNGFFFHNGDHVVFLGDSITEQYQYSTYIELYLTTRFPNGHMTFHNAGISGDTARGGSGRFVNQVMAEKPTAVTIDFGMNDGGYGGFDEAKAEQFIKSTEQMLMTAKKAGVRVALISPNAVEVRSRPNLKTYLETQEKFYAPLKQLAAKYDMPFVDQYAVTRKILERIAADDAKVKPFPDAIHTGPAGGLLMAHTILKGLDARPEVSLVEIDAPKNASNINYCAFKNLKVDDAMNRVSFDRTDFALAMPLLKEWRELLPYVDQMKDFNNYALQVKGLKPGKYEVKIDDQPVATYTADELAAGVNVGNADKGPIYDQGMKVLRAINAKNDIVHKRFREVVMFDGKNVPVWLVGSADEVARKRQDELAKREERITAMQAEVYKLATPVTHRWEVKLVD